MLIQTKPKPAGKPVEAVQFLGDPSVHPAIWWQPEEKLSHGKVNKAHWRLGGEGRGGGYDFSSSYLEIGDWIIGRGHGLALIHPKEFERDWQVVPAGASDQNQETNHE